MFLLSAFFFPLQPGTSFSPVNLINLGHGDEDGKEKERVRGRVWDGFRYPTNVYGMTANE